MPDDGTIAELTRIVREMADRLDGQLWPRWMGVARAAAYCDLGEKSIRNMVASGVLTPSRTVRGKVLIDRYQLDAAMSAGCGARLRKGRGIRT